MITVTTVTVDQPSILPSPLILSGDNIAEIVITRSAKFPRYLNS